MFQLFGSILLLSLLASDTTDQTTPSLVPTIQLVLEHQLDVPNIKTSTSVALAVGGGGELYLLTDNPPQTIMWDGNNRLVGQFADGLFTAPTDIYCNSGIMLLIADPFQESISRFDRHLKQSTPVKIVSVEELLEPLSVCRSLDGTMFIVNRADNDLWRIEQNGRAIPFEGIEGRWLTDPVRVRYLTELDALIVLDGDRFVICNTFGTMMRTIPAVIERPVNFNVIDNEVWIIGEGLVVIDLSIGQPVYNVSSDSLKSWGVYPPIDVLPHDEQVFILARDKVKVISMKIVREIKNKQ